MSTKRNKKNVVDPSTNNNYKKSKNTISAAINNDAFGNVKNKKKENASVLSNNKRVSVGNKRKLSESDVTPMPKKTKKRGKVFTNSNIIEPAEDLLSEPSGTLNANKESKKSKKKTKLPLNNEESFVNNIPNDALEPFVQKVGKKKKSNKDKICDDHVSSVAEKVDTLKKEIDSKVCDEIDVQQNNFENENVSRNKQCIENGSIHLPIKDLDDSQSNLNEPELFPDLVKKTEMSDGK